MRERKRKRERESEREREGKGEAKELREVQFLFGWLDVLATPW